MSFSFIATLLLSILLVLTTKLNFTPPFAPLLFSLTNPLLLPITAVRVEKDSFVRFLQNTPSLSLENEKLKNENNLLKIRAKKLTDLIRDQETLKNLDSLWPNKDGSVSTRQIQPVKLVSLDHLASFTSLNFANIRPGQPVATGNSLVGLVKSVEPPIIRVIPLNHPDAKLAIQLDTGAKGDYAYKKDEPRIINLDTNVAFNSKTTIFTLPSSTIPEDLIIGQIDKITSSPADPTQEATIILDQNLAQGRNFFIITQP